MCDFRQLGALTRLHDKHGGHVRRFEQEDKLTKLYLARVALSSTWLLSGGALEQTAVHRNGIASVFSMEELNQGLTLKIMR